MITLKQQTSRGFASVDGKLSDFDLFLLAPLHGTSRATGGIRERLQVEPRKIVFVRCVVGGCGGVSAVQILEIGQHSHAAERIIRVW